MTKTKVFKWLAVALIILLSALSFYIFGDDSQVLFANASANEKPLRLHVLANSDSTEDQQLKLQVRDFIITLLKPQLADIDNKEAAMNLIEANIPQLTEACNAFLNGKADYQATLALERADFPEINYDGMFFASGEYDALRIILGEGEGKNWWCVLFPPLCFVDLASEYDPDLALSVWSSYTGEQSDNGVQIKWKLSELFGGK